MADHDEISVEFRGYVKRALETIDKKMDKVDTKLDRLDECVDKMKVKVAAIGSVISLLVTITVLIIKELVSK